MRSPKKSPSSCSDQRGARSVLIAQVGAASRCGRRGRWPPRSRCGVPTRRTPIAVMVVSLPVVSTVVRSTRERRQRVGPGQAAVRRALGGVDAAHGAARHVTQLHAVAQLVGRVDGVGQPATALVERELAHVAHVEHRGGAELVQHQVAAARRPRGTAGGTVGGTAACGRGATGAVAAAGCVAVQGDPARCLTGERDGAHLVDFPAARRSPGSPAWPCPAGLARLPQLSAVSAGGPRQECRPLAVCRQGERRIGPGVARRGSAARGRRRDLAQDHLGVALVGHERVAEPLAVVAELLPANGLPGRDILRRDGGCDATDGRAGGRCV